MFPVPSFTLLRELTFLYLSSFYPGVSCASPAQRHNSALRPGLSQQQKSPESRVVLPTATAKGTCQISLRTRAEPEHLLATRSQPCSCPTEAAESCRTGDGRAEGKAAPRGMAGDTCPGPGSMVQSRRGDTGHMPSTQTPCISPTGELQLLRTEGSGRGTNFKGIPPSALYASCPVAAIRPALTIAHRNSVPRACDSVTAQAAEGPPRALC